VPAREHRQGEGGTPGGERTHWLGPGSS